MLNVFAALKSANLHCCYHVNKIVGNYHADRVNVDNINKLTWFKGHGYRPTRIAGVSIKTNMEVVGIGNQPLIC